MTNTIEFGPTKLFQNLEQKTLYEAIQKHMSSSAAVLIDDRSVKKIVAASGAENDSLKARKVRLRGRVRVLRQRFESRGMKLPA